MKTRKIALITYSDLPQLSESDHLLIEPLKEKSFEVLSLPWDSEDRDWKGLDCLVLRSCWNYHKKYKEFVKWLDYLQENKVRVFNSVSIVKWNSNKKYLLELERRGIDVVPTIYVKKRSKVYLKDLLENKKWQGDVVIKPAVGASAYKIFKANSNNLELYKKRFDSLKSETDVLIQPLMKEVVSEGEYSSVVIAGQYSHSILKTPKKGDFRSNYHFGAKEKRVCIDRSILDQVMSIYNLVDANLLYARVDYVIREGKVILMELELIEPHLFFDMKKDSAKLFALKLSELVQC